MVPTIFDINIDIRMFFFNVEVLVILQTNEFGFRNETWFVKMVGYAISSVKAEEVVWMDISSVKDGRSIVGGDFLSQRRRKFLSKL